MLAGNRGGGAGLKMKAGKGSVWWTSLSVADADYVCEELSVQRGVCASRPLTRLPIRPINTRSLNPSQQRIYLPV